MSDILGKIIANAKAKNKNIVLPEGEDKRVVKAACEVVKAGFARITLLGNKEEILAANPDVIEREHFERGKTLREQGSQFSDLFGVAGCQNDFHSISSFNFQTVL